MKLLTKIILAAAVVGTLGLGSKPRTVYAKQPQSQAAIMPRHHSSPKTSVLKIGSRGQAVTQVQNILTQEGFYKGPINGIFSRQMQAAVIAFQKSEHIKPDGTIGPQTQAAMK